LVRHFLLRHGGEQLALDPAALRRLCAYDWPGNVRELENAVERMVLLRRNDTISVADLPAKIAGTASNGGGAGRVLNLPDDGYSLEALEKEAVLEALARCHNNQTKAAAFLRIPRHTLLYRMEKFGLHKEKP
jgi:two-component system NtrC family response regulator